MPQEDRSYSSGSGASDGSAADVISLIAREAGEVVWFSKPREQSDEDAPYTRNFVRFDGQEHHDAADLARLLWRLTGTDLSDCKKLAAWPEETRAALGMVSDSKTHEDLRRALSRLALKHEPFVKVVAHVLKLKLVDPRRPPYHERGELLDSILGADDGRKGGKKGRGRAAQEALQTSSHDGTTGTGEQDGCAQSEPEALGQVLSDKLTRKRAGLLFDACALYRNSEAHDAPERTWSELGEGLNHALGFYLLIIDAHYEALSDILQTDLERALNDTAGLRAYLSDTIGRAVADQPNVYVDPRGRSGGRQSRALDLLVEALDAGSPFTVLRGGAGVGKTTLLRDLTGHLARHALERLELSESPIQIPVLYTITTSGLPEDFLFRPLNRMASSGWRSVGSSVPEELFSNDRFQWVLLVDGVDQADDCDQTLTKLDLLRAQQRISIIATARTGSLPEPWLANQYIIDLLPWGEDARFDLLSQTLEEDSFWAVWNWLQCSRFYALLDTPLRLAGFTDYARYMAPEDWSLSHPELEAAHAIAEAVLEHHLSRLPQNQRANDRQRYLDNLRALACTFDGRSRLPLNEAEHVAGQWLQQLISLDLIYLGPGGVSFAHEAVKLAYAVDQLRNIEELPDPNSELRKVTEHWTYQFKKVCQELLGSRDYAGMGLSEMLTAV